MTSINNLKEAESDYTDLMNRTDDTVRLKHSCYFYIEKNHIRFISNLRGSMLSRFISAF